MYIIGLAIFATGMLSVMYFSHIAFSVLGNPSVIALMVLSLAGIVVATNGYRTFIKGLNGAISRKYFLSDDDREEAISLFRLLSKASLLVSIAGMFLKGIMILTYMEDIEMVAHAVSATVMFPIYGIGIALSIFEPAIYILKHAKRSEEGKITQKQMSDKLLELCYQNNISPEDIVKAKGIELKK